MKTPFMKTLLILASLSIAFAYATAAHAVMFDWAQIGNAGNAADNTGYGAVEYDYAIGKTGVTNAQYVEFLNSVAATDVYDLYNTSMGSSSRGGITRTGTSGNYTYAVKEDATDAGPEGTDYTYANKPINYLSWYDSMRFINWLHNGQGAGDTETGAYTLLGGTATPTNGLRIIRNTDAQYWLPSEDEWYKAAYYDGSVGIDGRYYDYATGTDIAPNNNLPTADTGNSVNHRLAGNYTNGTTSYPHTDVGAYSLSESAYGTYDQNGNVFEWNETVIRLFTPGVRGGSWRGSSIDLTASHRIIQNSPTIQSDLVGFRVATVAVPEPSSLLLLLSLTSGMLLPSRR